MRQTSLRTGILGLVLAAVVLAGCVAADPGTRYANEPVRDWPSQQALRSLHD
jgi:hypothetical protein